MQVKTKNIAVGALVVLLVGMLWYRVVYSPMESKASKAKAAAQDANTTSANLRQALVGTSTKKKTKTADVSTKALLAAVPIDIAEASFLRSVDAIRVSSGAAWQSVNPSPPTISGSVATVTVAITAQGTEDEITRYLTSLTTLPRVFIPDNVTITQGGSSASPSAGAVQGHAGSVFIGNIEQVQISGRIFASAAAASSTTTGAARAATGATGAPAPTNSAGTVNG